MKFGLLPNPLSARMNAEISSDEKIIDAVSYNGFATIFLWFQKRKEKRMCDYPRLYLWDWSANQHHCWVVRAARKRAVSVLSVLTMPSDRMEFDVSLHIRYLKIKLLLSLLMWTSFSNVKCPSDGPSHANISFK